MTSPSLPSVLQHIVRVVLGGVVCSSAACGGQVDATGSTTDGAGGAGQGGETASAGGTSTAMPGRGTAGAGQGGQAGSTDAAGGQAGGAGSAAGQGGAGAAGQGGASSSAGTAGAGGDACMPVVAAMQEGCGGPGRVDYPCGLPAGTDITQQAQCNAICGLTTASGASYFFCSSASQGGQAVEISCTVGCLGRRPEGMEPTGTDAGETGIGAYFAAAARLEAVSVDAFRILRAELAARRAPRRLLRAAAKAARDEVRHARQTGALAARFGGRVRPSRVDPPPPRSLEAVALENAVEGCVRETYGALVALWQARTARDPHVAAVMRRVARDEADHAALSFQVARWAERRLDPAARGRVAAARRQALAELARELRQEPSPELIATAGLPRAADAQRLLAALSRTLLAA